MAYLILLEMGSRNLGQTAILPLIRRLIKNKKIHPLGSCFFFTPDTVSFCYDKQAVEDVEAFLLLNLFDAMFQSAQFIFFDIYLPPLMDFCLRLKIHI